jgi:hypothetical protein
MNDLEFVPYSPPDENAAEIPNHYAPFYPTLVGLLLGLLQTGLFFQLTFTLSSSFGTFLLVTLCWLLGSAAGVLSLARLSNKTRTFLLVALLAYAACGGLLALFPFGTSVWPLYAVLIVISGFYPGVFFARMSVYYPARTLFARENNGFIGGLVLGTIAFLLFGRIALWALPLVIAIMVLKLDSGSNRPG